MRLHLMMNGPKSGDPTRVKQVREVMFPDGEGRFDVVRRSDEVLSKAYADVKLAGPIVQVRVLDGGYRRVLICLISSVTSQNSGARCWIQSILEVRFGPVKWLTTNTYSTWTGMDGPHDFIAYLVAAVQ